MFLVTSYSYMNASLAQPDHTNIIYIYSLGTHNSWIWSGDDFARFCSARSIGLATPDYMNACMLETRCLTELSESFTEY